MQRVIHLDLPSAETDRHRSRVDRLRQALGGTVPEGSGRERLTLSTLAVVEGLAEGLRRVGIDDVVRFEVDGEVIVEDPRDEPGDLPFIVTQAIGAGLLDRPFQEMRLHARDEMNGTPIDIVAYVRAEVEKGAEEVRVNCTAGASVNTSWFEGRVDAIARGLSAELGGGRWRIAR